MEEKRDFPGKKKKKPRNRSEDRKKERELA